MLPAKCFSINDRISPHVNKYHLKATGSILTTIFPYFHKLQVKTFTTKLKDHLGLPLPKQFKTEHSLQLTCRLGK